MTEQIVELRSPGLMILLCSPLAMASFEQGRDYGTFFPDGRDLVDHVNTCQVGALGVRWPDLDYWLHFSSTMDHSVIARTSDHVRLGVEVDDQLLHVRAGDDLFRWDPQCPNDQVISLPNGTYDVTACMVPFDGGGPVQIYLHFAKARARPELGYGAVPELFCEAPVW